MSKRKDGVESTNEDDKFHPAEAKVGHDLLMDLGVGPSAEGGNAVQKVAAVSFGHGPLGHLAQTDLSEPLRCLLGAP